MSFPVHCWASSSFACRRGFPGRHVHGRLFAPRALPRPQAQGHAEGYLVQPAPQSLPFADGAGLAQEHEEGGLEAVFGVVLVPKDPATQA